MRMARLENMSVNEELRSLLGELSNILREHSDSELLESDPYLQAIALPLRRIFAEASYAYEKFWADKLLNMPDLLMALQEQYPYYKSYEHVTKLEYQALSACFGKPLHRILMVGSGPLPMTSIQLVKYVGKDLLIDSLDINEEASQIGEQICKVLGLTSQMHFITRDILEKNDLAQYDAIWLAALAGNSHNKARLIDHLHVHTRPGTLMLVRTAFQLRGLIYPVITTKDLMPFTLRLKIQTYRDNFHSIYLVQR